MASSDKKRSRKRVTKELDKFRFEDIKDYVNHINTVHYNNSSMQQPVCVSESINIKLKKKKKMKIRQAGNDDDEIWFQNREEFIYF